GRSSRDFRNIKEMMWAEDGRFDALMEKLSVATIAYLQGQIDAGVQAVQLFDTWVEALHPIEYGQYVARYNEQIMQAVGDRTVPRMYFGKRWQHIVPWLGALPCEAFALGPQDDPSVFIGQFGHSRAIQGKADPAVLYADQGTMRVHVGDVLRRFEGCKRHIFNLGSGLMPDMTLEQVKRLVAT